MKKIALILLLSITLTSLFTGANFHKPTASRGAKAADLTDERAALHSCKPEQNADFGVTGQTFKSVTVSAPGDVITITYESGKKYAFTYKETASKTTTGSGGMSLTLPWWWIYQATVNGKVRYMATLNAPPTAGNGFKVVLFVKIFDSYSTIDPDGLGPYTNTEDSVFDTLANRFNNSMTDGPQFNCKQAFGGGNISGWNITKGADNEPPVITIEASTDAGFPRPKLDFKFDLMAFIDGWARPDNNFFYFRTSNSEYKLYAVRLNMTGKSGELVQMTDAGDLGTPVTGLTLTDAQKTLVYQKLIQWVYNDKNGDACSKMVGPSADAKQSAWTTANEPPQSCISLNGTNAKTDKADYASIKPDSWMAAWGVHVQIGGLESDSPDDKATNSCGSVSVVSMDIDKRMRIALCNLALGLNDLATAFVTGAVKFFDKVVGTKEY